MGRELNLNKALKKKKTGRDRKESEEKSQVTERYESFIH